jgi:AdoMet-dependent rRNA methyltransferase SPB1
VAITEDFDEEGQIQEELERLNNEASARAKRDRRKNNEKKAKTIQRMQLQMTAPMDIGQELEDASLQAGQEDIFDLKTADRRRKTLLTQADVSGSDEEEGPSDDDDDDDPLDSEEEREKRVGALGEDLDDLYDVYKTQRSERDAKFRAKESRKNNKDREETWGGIRKEKDPDVAESGSSAGGWEDMHERKGDNGESSDEGSSSSDSDSIDNRNSRKRKRAPEPPIGDEASNRKRQKLSNGLITTLKEPKTGGAASKASQIWFSQDIFAGISKNVAEMETQERLPPGKRPQQVELYLHSGGDALLTIPNPGV